jgi:hypothetical protein
MSERPYGCVFYEWTTCSWCYMSEWSCGWCYTSEWMILRLVLYEWMILRLVLLEWMIMQQVLREWMTLGLVFYEWMILWPVLYSEWYRDWSCGWFSIMIYEGIILYLACYQCKMNLRIFYWHMYLKGQSNEIFYLRFFHRWTAPKPLTRYLKTFRI